MNRNTVRSFFVVMTAALAAELPSACGSDDENAANSGAQTSTGGALVPAGGFGGNVVGPQGGTMNMGMGTGGRFGRRGGGNAPGAGGTTQTTTPCVAALCTPVATGEPCCVGTYGPCGALIGGQCTATTQGGGRGGRTGRGGQNNSGGQNGNGGATPGNGGAAGGGGAGTGGGGAAGASGASGAGGANVDASSPPADSGPGGPD